MQEHNMRLTILGARGSIPVSGIQQTRFGGSTSCYMVEADGETVFLDAGSGLVSAPVQFEKPPIILLSHLHLDHLLGLGMYPRLSETGAVTRLYLRAASTEEAKERLAGIFAPPYWPLPLTDYKGSLELEPLRESFRVGNILIDCMEGRHPGGCAIFRLSCSGKRLVYATDYEPDEASFSRLISFSRNADLLLYDAQYTAEEYESKRGFGHSTAEKGIELMKRSGAKSLLLIHHSPQASDEELLRRERVIGRENVHYAREGETICL